MFKNRQPKSLENTTCFLSGTLRLPFLLEVNMKKIKLHGKYGDGKFTLIDDDDFQIINLFKWYPLKDRSTIKIAAFVTINGKQTTLTMSRLIMNAPRGKEVDHKNHHTFDNRKQNLRICSNSQNQMNRLSNKNSTSQYKGVSWYKRTNTWRSGIKSNGKQIHIGLFKNEIDAAKAYNERALELFGEYANLNNLNKGGK